jgi:hypothetical protein
MISKLSSLQAHLKNAGQLVRAENLLAAARKVEGLKPLAQRQMAGLKDRIDLNHETLRVFAASLEPIALDPFWMLLILLGGHSFEDIAFLPDSAARAYRTLRPSAPGGFESRRFVMEMGLI